MPGFLSRLKTAPNRAALLQTAAYYAAFVALGLVMSSLGPTLGGLAEHTGSSLSQIGILFTVRSIGGLTGALVGSRLYDRVPGNQVAAIMLLALVCTLALAPIMPLLWLLCLVMFIFGIAESTLDIGGNTLLLWVHRRNSPPFMNGLHFFFGIGAFLSPLIIAQAVLWSGDITWAYWALALLLLPVAAWLLRVPSPPRQGAVEDPATRKPNNLLVGLIMLFFFLYVGAEVAFGGWIFSFSIASTQVDETMAAYLTSAFWGAFTVGRLVSIPIVSRTKLRTVLVSDLVGALLSLGLLVLWPTSLPAVWVGTLGFGFAIASIFPTIFSMAERQMTITGRISGFFYVGTSFGAMTIPWLIGQLLAGTSPRAMMVCLLVDLALALAVVVALIRLTRDGPGDTVSQSMTRDAVS